MTFKLLSGTHRNVPNNVQLPNSDSSQKFGYRYVKDHEEERGRPCRWARRPWRRRNFWSIRFYVIKHPFFNWELASTCLKLQGVPSGWQNHFCQIPTSRGIVGQTVEQSNSKSTKVSLRPDETPCSFGEVRVGGDAGGADAGMPGAELSKSSFYLITRKMVKGHDMIHPFLEFWVLDRPKFDIKYLPTKFRHNTLADQILT